MSGLAVARPLTDPTIRVQIPAGTQPGQAFVIRLDNGEQFSVTCPPGSHGGDFLDIVCPRETPPAPAGSGGAADNIKLSKAQVGLAGAGAAAGLLLAGPLTAVALAGAGAYAASKEGPAGASAKELGKKAFDLGSRAAAMAKEKLTEAASHVAAEADRQRQRQLQSQGSAASASTPVAIAYPVEEAHHR